MRQKKTNRDSWDDHLLKLRNLANHLEYYDEEAKSKEVFLKFIDHTDPYLSDKMRTYVDYFTNEYEYELEKLIKVLYYRYGPGNKTNNNSNNNSTTNKKGYQIPGKSINTVRCKNCNKNGHDTEKCWFKYNNQNRNYNSSNNIPKVHSKTIRITKQIMIRIMLKIFLPQSVVPHVKD